MKSGITQALLNRQNKYGFLLDVAFFDLLSLLFLWNTNYTLIF